VLFLKAHNRFFKLYSEISNQQSAISNQQSAISNQQSAISNQQSAISNQQSLRFPKNTNLIYIGFSEYPDIGADGTRTRNFRLDRAVL
jgi:hypothetical protein